MYREKKKMNMHDLYIEAHIHVFRSQYMNIKAPTASFLIIMYCMKRFLELWFEFRLQPLRIGELAKCCHQF